MSEGIGEHMTKEKIVSRIVETGVVRWSPRRERATEHRVHTWVRAHISLSLPSLQVPSWKMFEIYHTWTDVCFTFLTIVDSYVMLHARDFCVFTCQCLSVTFCFQLKKSTQPTACPCPTIAEKPTRRRPTRSGTKASSMREWKSAEERGEREARRRRRDRGEKASFHCDLFASDHLRPLRTSLMCTTPSTPFRARHPRRRPMSSETETSPTKGLLRVPPLSGRWLGRSKRTLCCILFRDTNTEFRSTWRATEEEEEKTLRAPRRQHHGGEPRVSQSEGLVSTRRRKNRRQSRRCRIRDVVALQRKSHRGHRAHTWVRAHLS